MHVYAKIGKQEGIIVCKIERLKRISVEKAKVEYGRLVDITGIADDKAGVLLGYMTVIGRYSLDRKNLEPLKIPLKIRDYLYPLSKDLYSEIWHTEGNVLIGKSRLGIYYDENEDLFKDYLLNVHVDAYDFFTENMLIIGGTQTDRARFIKQLVSNLMASEVKYNIILFDTRGQYKLLFSDLIEQRNVEVISNNTLLSKFEYGFGLEYRGIDEIISIISPMVGYETTVIIRNLLRKIQEKGRIFKLDTLVAEIEKLDMEDEAKKLLIDTISEIWTKNMGKLLEPNKCYIISFEKGTRIRDQIQLLAMFFRELFSELTARVGREEKILRIIVVDEAEKFIPRKGFESVEVANISRENILNLLSHSKMYNIGLIFLTDYVSKLAMPLFYMTRNILIMRVLDVKELGIIKSYFGIDTVPIKYLQAGEAILKSSWLERWGLQNLIIRGEAT